MARAESVADRERQLFAGLMRRSTTVVWETLNFQTPARVNDSGPLRIVVDPFRGGFIESAVHELAHRVWQKRLSTSWPTASGRSG